MSKNIIIGSIVLLIFIGFIFTTIKTESNIKIESTEMSEAEIKDVLFNGYMEGCVTKDTNREFCSCSFQKMMSKHGLKGFFDIADNYDKYGFDERAETAAIECIYWLM